MGRTVNLGVRASEEGDAGQRRLTQDLGDTRTDDDHVGLVCIVTELIGVLLRHPGEAPAPHPLHQRNELAPGGKLAAARRLLVLDLQCDQIAGDLAIFVVVSGSRFLVKYFGYIQEIVG